MVAPVGSRLVRTLIIGAAGMIGRKLAARLPQDDLILHDVVPFDGASVVRPLGAGVEAEKLIARRPELIFHLAAVVSGEAEADFDKGYRVNLDGTRELFRGHPQSQLPPRVVSHLFYRRIRRPPFPEAIGDEFPERTAHELRNAKGHRRIAALLDYSRRGFFDGIGLRLPTICVRPGKPNKAASGFFSGIIREPLAGQEAVLPVPETVRHWFASPRAAIGFLLHAAKLDTAKLGARRNLSMPGVSATVGEQIEALRKVAGEKPPASFGASPTQRSCASSKAGRPATSIPGARLRSVSARMRPSRTLSGFTLRMKFKKLRTSARSRVNFIGGRLFSTWRP